MLTQDTGVQHRMIGMSIEYGHYLEAQPWRGGEDIQAGMSGNILFFLELYAATRHRRYLTIVGDIVDQALAYCRNTPTLDYSLYTGRAGFVYALLQYYSLTGEERFISHCAELMAPAVADYLESKRTTDYLYDGRAGSLLVLFLLYQVSGDPGTATAISRFLEKIMANAHLSSEGIYWTHNTEIHLRPSGGMAFGASGIRYVLKQLASGNPVLDWLVRGVDEFVSQGWIHDIQNWGNGRKEIRTTADLHACKEAYVRADPALFQPLDDLGWADGATGILLSSYGRNVEAHSREVAERLVGAVTGKAFSSASLYDGLAGTGLLFLENRHIWGDQPWRQAVLRLTGEEPAGYGREGLLHGYMGVCYLLLRAANPESPFGNVLAPSAPKDVTPVHPVNLPIEPVSIGRAILAKRYPRTVGLLVAIAPAALDSHLPTATAATIGGSLTSFSESIIARRLPGISPSAYERLLDIFQLEKRKLDKGQRKDSSSFRTYLEDIFYHDKALDQLNHPDEWLRRRVLSISPAAHILSSKWDWGFEGDYKMEYSKALTGRHLENLQKPPRKYEYLCPVAPEFDLQETFLKTDAQLLLHQFDSPKQVNQAIQEIRQYIGAMPDAVLEQLLLTIAEFVDVAGFKGQLNAAILFQIRQWIYRNVLVIKE